MYTALLYKVVIYTCRFLSYNRMFKTFFKNYHVGITDVFNLTKIPRNATTKSLRMDNSSQPLEVVFNYLINSEILRNFCSIWQFH